MSDYGNPGSEYEKTRHNVGFRAIDELAKNLKIDMQKNKFDAIIGDGYIGSEKVILMKPQTYMNLSGTSVRQIMDFYKLETENLIVIYDDIDIELGKIKVRKNGGPGTHNGMRNIVQMLSSENFPRIRIGTDKPKYNMDLATFVLMPMSNEDNNIAIEGIMRASSAAEKIITSGVQVAMNEFNGL